MRGGGGRERERRDNGVGKLSGDTCLVPLRCPQGIADTWVIKTWTDSQQWSFTLLFFFFLNYKNTMKRILCYRKCWRILKSYINSHAFTYAYIHTYLTHTQHIHIYSHTHTYSYIHTLTHRNSGKLTDTRPSTLHTLTHSNPHPLTHNLLCTAHMHNYTHTLIHTHLLIVTPAQPRLPMF